MERSHRWNPPFRYAYVEIRTQMVVICGLTRYQLDYGGARMNDMAPQYLCEIISIRSHSEKSGRPVN